MSAAAMNGERDAGAWAAGRRLPAALLLLVLTWGAAGGAAGPTAAATTDISGGSDVPVVIEADEGIEWRQNERVYVARGNARATRGDVTVRADVLTAHYRPGKTGKSEIWKVVAEGNVVIFSKSQSIRGDKGIYRVDTGVFVMTGKALKLQTPDVVVTARDRLEYRAQEQVALFIGHATAIRKDKKITARMFKAQFKEDARGQLSLHKVDAVGDVVITTPTEIARADRGVYNAATGIATLSGSVRLTRGKNQMNGGYAEVNMNTGVSRLLAGSGSGRVRGLFVPGGEGDLKLPVPPSGKP